MEVSKEIKKAMDKAKIGLMSKPDSTFFTTIVFSLKFIWDNTQPTAYTNGTVIGFNSDFFMGMTPGERIGVLVHEAMHVAYMHMARLMGKDPDIWNQAADHVINLQLLACGFELPAMRLADERFIGMSAEQVYKILFVEKQGGVPQLPNHMQDLREAEQGEAELKQAVDVILTRAKIQSRMAGDKPGSVPGDIEFYLESLLTPKLPWTKLLRRWLTSTSKHGYSWHRPNRRFAPQHYLPSRKSRNRMENFQAWTDISGSETDEDFQRYVSELAGILRELKPKKIDYGLFDTVIKSITTIRNLDDLKKMEFHGRGGTCITDVLDHIEKTKPTVAVIFTDGGFRMDRNECLVPILWMIHDNPDWTAPFGKVVHFNTHN